MTTLNIFMLVTAGINLFVGLVVFFKKMRSSLHQSFLFFCIGSSLWTVSYVLLSHTQLLVFDRLIILGSLISTAGIFLFSKYFPTVPQHVFTKKDGFLVLPLLFCSLLLFDNLIIKQVEYINSIPVPQNGPLFGVFAAILVGYLGASIYYLIRNYNRSNPIEQNRASIFTLSLIIFVLVSIVFDLVLPIAGYTGLNYIGPLFLSLFVISCAYTLLAKQLLDSTFILQKTFIYSALLIIVSIMYYLLIVGIQKYVVKMVEVPMNVNLITIAIVAVSVPYIDAQLRKISDRWLGGKKYHYSGALLKIVKEISKTDTLEHTIQRVTQRISLVMKAQETRITIAHYHSCLVSNDPIFSQRSTQVYIPIVFQKQYIATLSVREKKSGEKFTKRDIDFLQTVCVYLSTHLKTLRWLQETQQYSHNLEDEIRGSERVAEKLQEDQNKMIVDIAHNLQTPLTILKGEIHSLQNAQKRFTRRDLKKLDKTIDRFSQFVTRLLQAGDTTQPQLHMTTFNVSEVVREICEYTRTVAESQSITFNYTIDEEVLLYGDATSIRDVLVNILSNAMKYRKANSPHEVAVSLCVNENITIAITDTGVGIKSEHLPYIFKPWYQADTIHQGSGLGLAIAQQTITQHRGTITVNSTYGSGTCVTITLPNKKLD